ncbi:MAG: class I SAM-dependent methyltransferase [Bacteroidetes bacterium]|nr:MAG: class I SAM-dependent methyltransferase [Bacteroidota bacterium]
MVPSVISSEKFCQCNCPVCLTDRHEPECHVKGFSIVRCTNCKMVYVNPRLNDVVIREIYRKNYFIKKDYSFNDFGYGNYDLTAHLRDKTFNRWYAAFAPFLMTHRGKAMDVGCATGRFLNILKNKGWEANGIELDVDRYNALLAKKFRVKNIPIEDYDRNEQYELITLFDVIEHITHLDACFKKLNLMLSDKGSIVMVTPNIESFQKKLFGKKWFQFKPWEHISYFSPKTVHRLAERFGFKIIYLSECGQYADMSFVHHRLLRYGFNRTATLLKMFLSMPGIKDKAWYVGTGSMLIVMQKKSL